MTTHHLDCCRLELCHVARVGFSDRRAGFSCMPTLGRCSSELFEYWVGPHRCHPGEFSQHFVFSIMPRISWNCAKARKEMATKYRPQWYSMRTEEASHPMFRRDLGGPKWRITFCNSGLIKVRTIQKSHINQLVPKFFCNLLKSSVWNCGKKWVKVWVEDCQMDANDLNTLTRSLAGLDYGCIPNFDWNYYQCPALRQDWL